MALTDTGGNRRIFEGEGPVKILLTGVVNAGDPIMYSSGWTKALNTSGKPAILIAGQHGDIGEIITAFVTAVIEISHAAGNQPTVGQLLAVTDAGLYGSADTAKQDIGYVTSVDTDTLHSRALVGGWVTELDTAGTT